MTNVHPSPEQLVAFRLGQLDDAAMDEVAAHVSDCGACCQRLREVPEDSFVSLVRVSGGATEFAASTPAVPVAASEGTVDDWSHETAPEAGFTPAAFMGSRYEILATLGQGGMGVVYQARHTVMDRVVALKVVRPRFLNNPTMVERFRREVKSAARLIHPNIVTAYDADEAGGLHFLVMEYVPGQSLAHLVRQRGPLPVEEACGYIRQAAIGLQHAHQMGMVHRDIKPQNLMVAESRGPGSVVSGQTTVKILDFGLARLVSESSAEAASGSDGAAGEGRLTQASTVMGTPEYIAPEQAASPAAADIRADIYSLGCTLYYTLAGRAPFPHGSALDKVKAHQEQPPPPLSEARPETPADLVRVVERMLAKDPTKRFQMPAEVVEALLPFCGGAAVAPDEKPQSGQLPRKSRFRRFALAASLAIMGLVLVYLFIPPVQDFAQTLIRIATNKGILEIEADDEDLDITIRQAGKEPIIDVINKRTKRAFVLSASDGEIEMNEKDTGKRLKTTAFTLERGGRRIFSATMLLAAKTPAGTDPAIPPAEDEPRLRRLISQNNLNQIILALHVYLDTHTRFPPAAICDPAGKPLLSWRVAILPYIEQGELYKQFKLNEPWDSPHNIRLLDKMPNLYGPRWVKTDPLHATYYQAIVGPGAAFEPPGKGAKGMRGLERKDFTNNRTMLLAEAATPVPWTKPSELTYDPSGPVPKLGGLAPPYFHYACLDGRVSSYSNLVDEKTLRALLSRHAERKVAVKEGAAFEPLFNGSDLKGWVADLDRFRVEDGVLIGKNGMLRSVPELDNYELRLQYRYGPGPADGMPASVSLHWGAEQEPVFRSSFDVNLYADSPPDFNRAGTANYLDYKGKKTEKPGPDWNHLHIICERGTIQIFFNGEQRLTASQCVPSLGYVALYAREREIHFRNIEVRRREVAVAEKDPAAVFQPLFNGKDLRGWKAHTLHPGLDPARAYSVCDNIVSCSQYPKSVIIGDAVFKDYVLKLDFKFPMPAGELQLEAHRAAEVGENPGFRLVADKGGRFRLALVASPKGSVVEKRVTVRDSKREVPKAPAKKKAAIDEEIVMLTDDWNQLELRCVDDRIALLLNGKPLGQVEGVQPRSGHISLSCLEQIVQLRDVRLAPVTAARPLDMIQLQGVWALNVLEHDGKRVPLDDLKDASMEIRFGDGDFEMSTGAGDKAVRVKGTFAIDPAKKEIILKIKSDAKTLPLPCSYRLEGGRLVLEGAVLVLSGAGKARMECERLGD